MPVMKVFFTDRNMPLHKAVELRAQQGPHQVLEIGKSPLPENGKIRIKVTDVKFHPIDKVGKEIPLSEKEWRIFDIAEQVGDSRTGDIDIIAYALPDT